MLAERTNTLAAEFTQSGTGHFSWKATATFGLGSDSRSIDGLIFTLYGRENN